MGIELKATLKARKLLIPLNEKNGKNAAFAQLRYVPGTRSRRTNAAIIARLCHAVITPLVTFNEIIHPVQFLF